MDMIIKKIKRLSTEVEMEKETPKETEKKEKTKKTGKSKNTLPPDTYKDEVEPQELYINENNKLVFSVKRAGELGLPHVDIRLFVTSDTYTGFTKKGINFPLEFLFDFMDKCQELNEECDKKGLE